MPAFDRTDAHSLDGLIAELEWLSLPGGQYLFEEGDHDDSLYMILSGRLGAVIRNEEGHQILIRKMTSGENRRRIGTALGGASLGIGLRLA